jgi:exodeoxyribonuclease V beta subunit
VQEYHNCFHAFGPMALFQKMLARRRIVQRLLPEPGGERKLTNYLHLAELLQEASLKLEGVDSLIRWFSYQMHNPEPDKTSQQLRLESDENLVRIVTIHKAKGLEYPVVFLPYLWRTRPVNKDAVYCFHHPGTGRIMADLGTGDPEYYRRAEQERLAEDLRLLYVAMTRARHMCCFCWGRIRGMEATPLAWLLHRKEEEVVPAGGGLDDRQVISDLSGLNNPVPILDYVPFPSDTQGMYTQGMEEKKILQPKKFTGKIDSGWTIMSYSQMTARFEEKELQAELYSMEETSETQGENKESVFDFPRGAAAGNCLHAVLEQLDSGDIEWRVLPDLVTWQLENNGIAREWTPLVCEWIRNIMETPLSTNTDIRLTDIRKEDRLAEMGFYFSIRNINIPEINRVFSDFSIPPLDYQPVHVKGLMKGYIDLVFCAGNRFFIADYKSNHLGAEYEDYRPQFLAAAMLEHRYDLQYLIYTVALHRYLRTRMTGYRYERDFGGIYYLFLRGMNPAYGPACGIFFTRPPRGLIERLDKCFGYPVKK